jgi:hypothetical protein
MRKLCSKCGNDLDLGSRFCPSCGAFNPFFISTFNNPSRPVLIPEKLLLEETTIASEIVSKAAEALIPAPEKEPEKQKLIQETFEKERQEREKIESGLKSEIRKVKEETEQYKKETIEMVNEVRGDIQLIEAENRKLKDELDALNRDITAAKPDSGELKSETVEPRGLTAEIRVLIVVLVFAAGVLGSLGYFYVTKANTPVAPLVSNPNGDKPLNTVNKVSNEPAAEPIKTEDSKLVAAVTAPVAKPAPASEIPVKSNDFPDFKLTGAKLRKDLIGKKLSGCGTQIDVENEIVELSEPAMIDKLPPNSFKFKFSVKFTQGGNSYVAAPYIYYDSFGNFLKIDGTNCE